MQLEVDAWVRMLAFMKEENVYFKNRLAEVMPQNMEKELLRQAETFQDSFIKNDTIFILLKKDIFMHELLIAKELRKEGSHLEQIRSAQKELREDMEKLERGFSRLTVEFNNYIDDISSFRRTA